MKKLLFVATVASVLSACSATKDPYDRRVEEQRKVYETQAERTLDNVPKWMNKLPTSTNAVYANGSGLSKDFSMADIKAKLYAFSSICTAAGGEVDKSSRIFMSDTEATTVERSEVAIRSMCKKVDVSGAEVVEVHRIHEGDRYRSFVLLSLPTGEANAILKRKDALRAQENARVRSDSVFTEMDKANEAKN
jgi:hypothetical protein